MAPSGPWATSRVLTPVLLKRAYTIQAASFLAAAMALVVGLSAGSGYIFGGLGEHGLPPSIGYVYVPAFAGLVIGASAGSPLGIRLSHKPHHSHTISHFHVHETGYLTETSRLLGAGTGTTHKSPQTRGRLAVAAV